MKKKIKIPKGYTEEQVVNIIKIIGRKLGEKFVFGYHDIEDLEQQAALIAWEGLLRYDGRANLYNFLYTHVHNRLHNYKRDNFERIDKPCKKCPVGMFDKEFGLCLRHNDDSLEDCEFYYNWIIRNGAKRNLMEPVDISEVDSKNEHSMCGNDDLLINIEYSEIIKRIKDKMPMQSMLDFDKFVSGAKMTSTARNKIKEIVKQILKDEGLINE